MADVGPSKSAASEGGDAQRPGVGTAPEFGDVVALCSALIRHDSSVTGERERRCAELVAAELTDMGMAPLILEAERGRSNVIARLSGTDPTTPALLLHIHLDVVPADPASWTVHPYSGEVHDGFVWGRGAVDMKNMAAMTLVALRRRIRNGWRPRRDLVLAFVADEERGGAQGAGWLVDEHRDLFEGCTEAIGEAGGFSHEYAPGRRAYFVQTGEKGIAWLHLVARGPGGHGALHHDRNAVTTLADAVHRINAHNFGYKLTASTTELLRSVAAWTTGDPFDSLGPLARLLEPALRNSYNVTGLAAGAQHNVVPPVARASIDGRVVPGYEDDFFAELAELVGDAVTVEVVQRSRGVQTPFAGPMADAIRRALQRADPGSVVVPSLLPISTDAKHFARLGMRCFGFTPMRTPHGYDFPGMFHGVDERVPLSALQFGQHVMEFLLDEC